MIPGPARWRLPLAFFSLVVIAALIGWGLAPAFVTAQDEGSPIAGSPEPEMFRNDPERNGESDGPGPSDGDQVEEIWSFDAGGDVQSSPAVVGRTVYFGSGDGSVYAVDIQTGEALWRFRTDGEVFSSPAVVDGLVLVGSEDNKLYALDAATGEERWSFETGDMIVCVAGGGRWHGLYRQL